MAPVPKTIGDNKKKQIKKRGRLFLLKNSGINLRILGKQKEWPPQIHFRTPAGLSKWMNAFTQQLFVCLFVLFPGTPEMLWKKRFWQKY